MEGTMGEQQTKHSFRTASAAVQAWYRFYHEKPELGASSILCRAAIQLYGDGHRSVEDIATILVGTYVGMVATRVNSATSSSIH